MPPVPAHLPSVLGALTAFEPMSIDMYLPSFPAFLVGLGVGQTLYGPLSDRVGRKPPLYAGIALYVVASAGCALAGGLALSWSSRASGSSSRTPSPAPWRPTPRARGAPRRCSGPCSS